MLARTVLMVFLFLLELPTDRPTKEPHNPRPRASQREPPTYQLGLPCPKPPHETQPAVGGEATSSARPPLETSPAITDLPLRPNKRTLPKPAWWTGAPSPSHNARGDRGL